MTAFQARCDGRRRRTSAPLGGAPGRDRWHRVGNRPGRVEPAIKAPAQASQILAVPRREAQTIAGSGLRRNPSAIRVGVGKFRERSLKRIPNGMNMVGLSYSGDGSRLVTLSSSQRISVFNATTLEKQRFAGVGSAAFGTESPLARASLACSSSSAGELVAFTSARNFIHIWNLDPGRRIDSIASGMSQASENSLSFRPDGQKLAIGNENDVAVIPLFTRDQTNALVSAPDKKINALSVRGDRTAHRLDSE